MGGVCKLSVPQVIDNNLNELQAEDLKTELDSLVQDQCQLTPKDPIISLNDTLLQPYLLGINFKLGSKIWTATRSQLKKKSFGPPSILKNASSC